MTTKPKVYIASPYTEGDQFINVKNQILTADRLMNLGFCPFTPLMSAFHNFLITRPYEDWMEFDLQWLQACDCVLRLPGNSKGADIEVNHAHNVLDMPVFYSVDELTDFYRKM